MSLQNVTTPLPSFQVSMHLNLVICWSFLSFCSTDNAACNHAELPAQGRLLGEVSAGPLGALIVTGHG